MKVLEAVQTLPTPAKQTTGSRLGFLDWTRGLAVAIILQGHVFHSFTRNDLRNDGPYVLSQFFGGLAPAIFLVLTGITLAFLMDRGQKQNRTLTSRWLMALRRAGYLFMLAFVFRLQLWLFAYGQSPWADLLKVDVLNCMGFTMAVISVMAVFTTADRVRMCAVLGIVIAAGSPVISSLDWTWLPPQVYNYFVPNLNYFSFFPWAAFIAFGVSIGSLLRLVQPGDMNRVMQWAALAGFGLVLGGQYFSNLPYSLYPKSDFWLDGPLLIFIRLGCVLLLLAFAYLWNEYAVKANWSWLKQFGTTSLLVYWVHIELVYGRWFGASKETLNTPQAVAASTALILIMLLLSVARTRWPAIKWPQLVALFLPETAPRRVSGD